MLAGGVAAAFVFHRADDDGVKKRVGEDGFLAGRLEVRATGSLARVGNQDDDAAAGISASFEGARSEKHGIVDGCSGAGGHLANRRLQLGNVIRKSCELRHVFIERKNGQAIPRAQHLADKVRGGFLFEADLFVGAQAGIDHDRQVQRLRSFGSNLSIFCSTPSSNNWKASLGRSGAGLFLSSRTLTRTLTRLTLTRIRPRLAEGSCDSSGEIGGVG